MKTTVDIPDDELEDAMKYAGAKTKRDAIVTALKDYNRRKRMAELVKYSATSDTLMSNEEIENLDNPATDTLKKRARVRRRTQ